MRALIVIGLLALVASQARAQAPECVEGRVRGDDGYCCWPGQHFGTDSRACEGPPQCPEPLVEHGEECVARLVPHAPSYEVFAAAPAYAPPQPRRTMVGWPAAHEGTSLHRAVHGHGEDGGLVAMSVVIFDVGWVLGLLTAALDEANHSCAVSTFSGGFFGRVSESCNSWPFAFLPVGGGLTSGLATYPNTPPGTFASRDNASWGAALGSPSVILQVAGLISLAISLANDVHTIGYPAIVIDGMTLSVVGAAPGADAGATVALGF